MSTKIFHGYISKLSIEQLLKKFVLLVPKFEELKNNLYYESLAAEATEVIDKRNHEKCECSGPTVFLPHLNAYCNENSDPDPDGICRVCNKNTLKNKYDQYEIFREVNRKNENDIRKAILDQSRQKNDYSCSCGVFPMGKNKTLILFYSENNEMTDMWQSLPYISEYHYQNSTDKPDYISSKDWNQRRRDWDKALGNDTPRERSFGFHFTVERLPFARIKECLKYVPKKSKRTIDLIYDTYLEKEIKRLKGTPEFKDNDSFYSLFEKAIANYIDYKKTDDYKKQILDIYKSLVKIDFESSKK